MRSWGATERNRPASDSTWSTRTDGTGRWGTWETVARSATAVRHAFLTLIGMAATHPAGGPVSSPPVGTQLDQRAVSWAKVGQ